MFRCLGSRCRTNWIPANATIGPYPRRNYAAVVTSTGGTRSKLFKKVLTYASKLGARIGAKSAYGSIHALGVDNKFVLKTMVFDPDRKSDLLKIFLNEVRVGGLPDISLVGPRIYAWRIVRDEHGVATKGEYIMDNFVKGDPTLTIKLASEYLKGVCPGRGHPLYAMLRNTLEKFWKVTGGYHGDLHMNNIAVLVNKDGTLVRVLIFDYGSHKKFKNPTEKCFDSIVRQIDREFGAKVVKKTPKYFPVTSRVRVHLRNRGQPRRSNANMLRAYEPEGKVIKHSFSKSIMSHLTNKNTFRTRFPGNLKNVNASGNVSHRHAFVSPNVWNKQVGWARPGNKLLAKMMKTSKMSPTTARVRVAEYLEKSPYNVYDNNRANFRNMRPENVERMVTNIGAKVFKPTRPGERLVKAYKTGPLTKAKKIETLKKVNRGRFARMSNQEFKNMVKNFTLMNEVA